MGAPTTYTEAAASAICERMSLGETLADILRDEGMPHRSAVYRWLNVNPSFAILFREARDRGFDAIAEEALHIADTPVYAVTIEDSEKNGRKTRRSDAVDHRKLQVWTRLQLLARWSPRYREANNVTVAGDPTNPLTINDQTAANRMAALLAVAEARKARKGDEPFEPEPDYSDLI